MVHSIMPNKIGWLCKGKIPAAPISMISVHCDRTSLCNQKQMFEQFSSLEKYEFGITYFYYITEIYIHTFRLV
jgi:hypothetical protein